jgi:hypothetical protein
MCFYRSSIRLISVVAILLWCSTASALTWSISQSGYAEGATISGSFTGVDINLDNQIASFSGEVTALTITFSGNSFVAPWTLGRNELVGLVYDVGTPFLGDGPGGFIEGLSAFGFGTLGFGQIESGLGPTGVIGGTVGDVSGFDTTPSAIAVTLVPEPSSALLIAIGLAGLGWRGRAKHA